MELIKKEKWIFPAEVELEYKIPEGSDAVKEVAKCVRYARKRWPKPVAHLPLPPALPPCFRK